MNHGYSPKNNSLIFSGFDPLPSKGGFNSTGKFEIVFTEFRSPFGDLGVRQTFRSGLFPGYMKLIVLLLFGFGFIYPSAGQKYLSGIPSEYKQSVKEAILKSGSNARQVISALEHAKKSEKKPVAFLLSTMPDRDLKSLSRDFILENVRTALLARKQFVWCRTLPDSVFLNEVLPYACLNETRDNWRFDFYLRFLPLVINCHSIQEAIDSVNLNIRKIVQVEYNTRRKNADQSPYESIEQKMASCTGLSILLTDAFRSVGIPSRIAGTPMWTNMKGNHNWCEVWINGHWYFTEYYPDKLNHSWFVADAGKADRNKPFHWIYATSWKPTGLAFPCVWDSSIQYVHARNVTDFYIDLYDKQFAEKKLTDDEVVLNVVLYQTAGSSDGSDRVSKRITVMQEVKEIDFGYSPGKNDDLNRFLPFVLKKNKAYTFVFPGKEGEKKSFDYTTGNSSGEVVRLYQ
jgi:hypothetical protein